VKLGKELSIPGPAASRVPDPGSFAAMEEFYREIDVVNRVTYLGSSSSSSSYVSSSSLLLLLNDTDFPYC
jgi:hypothetical protein